MNYIVLDLEWNQCPYGKEREIRRLPFEIIEIGAVGEAGGLPQASFPDQGGDRGVLRGAQEGRETLP